MVIGLLLFAGDRALNPGPERSRDGVAARLAGQAVRKFVYVPGQVVNLVVGLTALFANASEAAGRECVERDPRVPPDHEIGDGMPHRGPVEDTLASAAGGHVDAV